MATSEVAVSLAIVRLYDLLSKSKDIITYQKLPEQISDSISNLQGILNTRKHAEVDDDHNQLLLCARKAEKIAEEFLVKLFRHQMSKSQKSQFTKVFDLGQLFSVMNRGSAQKKMAKDFMTEVKLLFREFKISWPPAKSLPANESASSSSSSKRNQENVRQRVESDIVGRDQYVKDLLAWLINDNGSKLPLISTKIIKRRPKLRSMLVAGDRLRFIDYKDPANTNLRVISVVGEQACGKTALVRSVFSMLKVKRHFDCCVWVRFMDHWAESDRMKNLLVDILKQMPLRGQAKDLHSKQEKQLLEMLYKSLTGLRYLIVLDNLREASLINELLVSFVDSMTGSRVIVTTPNAEMQKFADPWTPDLRLGPDMTGEECEELLRVSITGGGNSIDDDMKSKITILKERILSKCDGSPLTISLLGGLLSATEVSNCEAFIKRLGDRPTLDDVMCLSFDELPHMMKPRLLYMALFPIESEIPTRRLFRLWAAEGLLAEAAADGSVQMRSAEDCFHEIESRNFIHVVRRKLDVSARSCRMPAFIHEFLYRKAKELGLLQILYSSDSVFDTEQSAQYQEKQPQNTKTGRYGYKVLRSFASLQAQNTCKLGTQAKEIKDLLKPPILDGRPLRVLDLEGAYKPELPADFENVWNLRYLGLRWTVLDSIPESVGNLLLLETLDLKHTNITKVTSAIWNAKNLRHLYLSEASFDGSIPGHISSESKLETLWGLFIETHDNPMIPVLEKLQNLKKLGLTCRPGVVKAVTERLSKVTGLESLRLRSRDLFGQPASLDLSNMTGLTSLSNLYLLGTLELVQGLPSVLPKNLKALTLSMSGLRGDLVGDLGCLNNLTVLKLLARSYTDESQPLRCAAGFPKLCVLKLWKLEELKSLVVEKGAMRELKELEIRQCKNLVNVDGLKHISGLESVSLTGVKRKLIYKVRVSRDIVNAKELID